MNTRKSNNASRFKNYDGKHDNFNLNPINIAKNTRSKNINLNKIYQLDHKNIKMDEN